MASATDKEIEDVWNKDHVRLIPLPYEPRDKTFEEAQAQAGIDELKHRGITFDPERTIWLGHDRITGAAAIFAAKTAGGLSALIHHMSYDHYESYAEDSATAYEKVQRQTALFLEANHVLAVGPLLRDALNDRLGKSKTVQMLIPGLAEIEVREAPITFTAFLSGRLSDDAIRIKQGHLGIAAFAQALREAREHGMPDSLCKQPKLVLRGVDFEAQLPQNLSYPLPSPENELKKFAEKYADCVINLNALPYTQDRPTLYNDLRSASVALMPSWHEGFGLVAWEAIAAGVPLIISKFSGVYQLLEEKYPGTGTGCVHVIDIRGAVSPPFFHQEDLKAVVEVLKVIANNPGKEREKASRLREMVSGYTWPSCTEQAVLAFGWHLQKGSIPPPSLVSLVTVHPSVAIPPEQHADNNVSPLRLPQRRWKVGSGIADSQLLRAEEAIVPFDPAGKPEIDTLNAWLDDPQWPQAVRLITGAGGLGKTRLALELCQQRIAAGWNAGFLDTDLGPKEMAAFWQTLRSFNQPLLIVVDYAEARQADLLSLIKVMLQNTDSLPVRLLLLARSGGEWWDDLSSKDPLCEPLLSGYATSGPFSLPPLYTAEPGRRQAYRQALHAFSQLLEVHAPDVEPELTGEHFDRPLYVQMAALLALHGERSTTVEGLTKSILNHERRYWRGLLVNFSWAEPERPAQELLTLATLAGGFATPKEAYAYWKKANWNNLRTSDFTALFYALAPLYPGRQGLQAVRPDLLGEALVSQAILNPEAVSILDAVLSSDASKPVRRHALTVIARMSSQRQGLRETLVEALFRHYAHCCHEIVEVIKETTGDLPSLAEVAFNRLSPASKSQVFELLESQIGEDSVKLAELNCLLACFLVERTRKKLLKINTVVNAGTYASALSNYSVMLFRSGRGEQALSTAFEAVTIYDNMDIKDRQRYERAHAITLNSYSNRLGEAGRDKEALEAVQKSFTIFQRLTQNNPALVGSEYAMIMSTYSVRLGEALQEEEALKYAQESFVIYQRMAQESPELYEDQLSRSLVNYALQLKNVGQYEDAIKYSQQAQEICQRLAQKNPDRYESQYANTLNNHAIYLLAAGRDVDALKFAEQMVKINRRLAQKNPNRYEGDYAQTLSNYSIYLRDAYQFEEAIKLIQESSAIYKRLTQQNPDRYESGYALSLRNWSRVMDDVGQEEEALKLAQEELKICQRLVQNDPDKHEPEYAESLYSYAIRLSNFGQQIDALRNVQQSVEIFRQLRMKSPARFDTSLYASICFADFQCWLCDIESKIYEEVDLHTLPKTIPVLSRQMIEFYFVFFNSCRSTDHDVRCEGFSSVLSKWDDLLMANKVDTEPQRLCAAAWCATFDQEAAVRFDWQASWRKFITQRNGHIPRWMSELALRLGFKWPM